MSIVKKIFKEFFLQVSKRGFYFAVIMNLSHLGGILRGTAYKMIYFRNIQSSIFSLQANSRIEIFNKNSKVTIGKFVFIRKNASIRVDFNGELVISEKVFINDNCNINCINKITIGSHTKIAPSVCINDHDHNYKKQSDEHLLKGEVIIGKNVWIGSNVVILRNTFIGDNAVIAAGSVVKGHVPANSVYVNKREDKIISFAGSPKLAKV